MTTDPWHFARTALAKQLLQLFETGLSTSLVFFAPRRMGKTEFLCKDIKPYAESAGWKVFYFSFLDAESTPLPEFTLSLMQFAQQIDILAKARGVLEKINKLSGEVFGLKGNVEFKKSDTDKQNMKEVFAELAQKGKILLLMDEVQVLAKYADNVTFISALRTALDMHKDDIKVIFTGSSQIELRKMFSQAKAPFFHFGQNLPFPELDKDFTDHLSRIFTRVTQRKLDSNQLWAIFQELQRVPQLIRSLVERVALNPHLSLEEAKNQLLKEVSTARSFVGIWGQCSILEKLLLLKIAKNELALFSAQTRSYLAENLGISELSTSTVQSSVRVLQRKGIIGQLGERSQYVIDDPNFKNWIIEQCEEAVTI